MHTYSCWAAQVEFLAQLARLDDVAPPLPPPKQAGGRPSSGSDSDSQSGRSPRELPERCAARGLFRWQARAPAFFTLSAPAACPCISLHPCECASEHLHVIL